MLGAIIGDIIGSRFEFYNGKIMEDFALLTRACEFTDDTVMSVAVGDALMKSGLEADEKTIKENVVIAMRSWGRKYPYAGYGGRFRRWLSSPDPKPYMSYGNGSAMRVSAVGWLYPSLERTLEVAKWTAEVTHNHPEGIKGAQCTAAVIYMARMGKDKNEIKEYVKKTFGYPVDLSLDELKKMHGDKESCQDSLPKALAAFFEGKNYEDTVRIAVLFGGDTDTVAAIAGSMSEAYSGIPGELLIKSKGYLNNEVSEVIERFNEMLR